MGVLNLFRKKKEKRDEIDFVFSTEELEKIIYEWNINNPIDRWWRAKHNIRFNSPEHRVASFIDMLLEFKEDAIYDKMFAPPVEKDEDEIYDPEKGNYIKEQGLIDEDISNEDLIKMFEKDSE